MSLPAIAAIAARCARLPGDSPRERVPSSFPALEPARGGDSPPKTNDDPPPGSLNTLDVFRSVKKFPTFCPLDLP
jgi:hypothetical protein